ncbi:unnamed protein product [Lactuca virosa]|uniref:Uncharacterized protein n=1 Tax=Lactuca virosa TaxID=75947 RepID=A0AAU9MLV8_9ASTR|nr:unnamed protein product [Lactuca virosa]
MEESSRRGAWTKETPNPSPCRGLHRESREKKRERILWNDFFKHLLINLSLRRRRRRRTTTTTTATRILISSVFQSIVPTNFKQMKMLRRELQNHEIRRISC